MGIKDLAKVISDHAPNAIKEHDMKHFFGRIVAIDASMSIYQFLIAVRQDGSQLQTESGETTSHLIGMLYRTIRLIENGVKPVYVFDGKPPELKSAELEKRIGRREEAKGAHEKAVEMGDEQAADKFSRRLVKVTREHNNDCKRLLSLMGIPYIDAPCEAEAQCAALVRNNKAYGTATEDMDGLTFGSNVLLRHMTFSEAKKMSIQEFHLDRVLDGFQMSMEEFIDLCILLGCDYCSTIRGIGRKKAFDLIEKHRNIETVLENLDTKKYPPPEDWQFDQVRKIFTEPQIEDTNSIEIKWQAADEEGLVKYLVGEKSFSEDRVRSALKKLSSGKMKSTQGRIDSFFTTIRPIQTAAAATTKRKIEQDNKKAGNKSKKTKTDQLKRRKAQ